MHRPRTTDDAGRPATLRRWAVMPWRQPGTPRDWLPRLIFLTPAGALTTFAVVLALAVALIATYSGAWIVAVMLYSPAAASIALLAALLAKSWHTVLSTRPERIKRTWLARGLCPSCGYALAGLDADPEGRVACPECGGTWLRDPKPAPRRVVIRA